MNAKVTVLPKRNLNCKLNLVSNEDWEKRFEFFWALTYEKTQIRHDLPPLLSRILCGSLLFVDFSVLSNFLARFSRFARRLLLLAVFGRSVSFFPAYFDSKPFLHELEL